MCLTERGRPVTSPHGGSSLLRSNHVPHRHARPDVRAHRRTPRPVARVLTVPEGGGVQVAFAAAVCGSWGSIGGLVAALRDGFPGYAVAFGTIALALAVVAATLWRRRSGRRIGVGIFLGSSLRTFVATTVAVLAMLGPRGLVPGRGDPAALAFLLAFAVGTGAVVTWVVSRFIRREMGSGGLDELD